MGVNVLEHKAWMGRVVRMYVRVDSPYYEDLLQEGMIALLEAARTFDETRGFSFLTYSTPAIHQHVRRYLRRAPVVHAPDVWSAERRSKLDRPAMLDQASEALSGSDASEDRCLKPLFGLAGMHTPASQEDEAILAERRAQVHRELARLSARHQKVIERVGLDGITFREAAVEMGCSRQRAQQLFAEGVETLQRRLKMPASRAASEAA